MMMTIIIMTSDFVDDDIDNNSFNNVFDNVVVIENRKKTKINLYFCLVSNLFAHRRRTNLSRLTFIHFFFIDVDIDANSQSIRVLDRLSRFDAKV